MSSKIVWQDLPEKRPGRGGLGPNAETQAALESLRSRPGVWALMASGVSSQSRVQTWKRHGCETATRVNPDGGFDIYARWPVSS